MDVMKKRKTTKSNSSIDKDSLMQTAKRMNIQHPVLSAKDICDIQYKNVTTSTEYNNLLLKSQKKKKQQQQQQQSQSPLPLLPPKVVLFTDGQKPSLDNTFPIIDNHEFQYQLWIMTLSTIHYGNPSSSIDHVIAHWRLGQGMIPTTCWKETNFIEYLA